MGFQWRAGRWHQCRIMFLDCHNQLWSLQACLFVAVSHIRGWLDVPLPEEINSVSPSGGKQVIKAQSRRFALQNYAQNSQTKSRSYDPVTIGIKTLKLHPVSGQVRMTKIPISTVTE